MNNKQVGVSFAQSVKEEICEAKRNDNEKRALLSGFIKNNGHLKKTSDALSLELLSESATTAKLMHKCVHDLYGIDVRFAYTRSPGFLKRIVYHIIIDENAMEILDDLEIDLFSDELPEKVLSDQEAASSYLAGAFLATGSVNDPMTAKYHLEIKVSDLDYANNLRDMFESKTGRMFHAKVTSRRNDYIVYLKRSAEISEFLVIVKATVCCLQYENVRVARDYNNQMNRDLSLLQANLSRTLKTSTQQIDQINYLMEHGGIDNFSNPKIKPLCQLRLKYDEASLNELADLLSQELGKPISKSNVNHLFREIKEEYVKRTNEKQ